MTLFVFGISGIVYTIPAGFLVGIFGIPRFVLTTWSTSA